MSSRGGIRRGSTGGGTPAAATTSTGNRRRGSATQGAGDGGAGTRRGARDRSGRSGSVPRRQPLSAERLEALAALAGINRLELTVERLVLGGDGLARWRGMPVFVPRAAPGDVVEVRITERRPSYARAEIEEVKAPGPLRREAPCPFYERCGGCQLQHIEDEAQLGLKAAAAVETLRRLGGIDPAVLAACRFEAPARERAWGYRLRGQVHVAAGAEGGADEAGAVGVGFRRRRRRELVLVDHCPVFAPALDDELARLPSLLGEAAAAGLKLPSRISLATAGLSRESPVVASPPVPGLPGGEVELTLSGRKLAYDARCFFQAHGGLLEALLLSAVGPHEGDAAVELYAGVGFFTVGLAGRYRSVTAVEGESAAARYARNNLRRNGLRHCRVDRSAVESWVDHRRGGPGLEPGLDRVLVDPPRGGLSRKVRSALLRAGPRRLTYVSCDPATLARDLGDLTRDFDLQSISFFDVFPQTSHLETVAQLRRRR